MNDASVLGKESKRARISFRIAPFMKAENHSQRHPQGVTEELGGLFLDAEESDSELFGWD